MTSPPSLSRRRWLERLALAASLTPVALRSLPAALAADAPLLSATAPEAQAVKYVENAKEAKAATPGSSCASCALYQGSYGCTQGPCQLFPGKLVKASGWCSAWAPQM